MSRIRILIVDDHAILRSGLKMLLSAQPDMEVVSEAADGDRAVQEALHTRPDVALMDLTMPGSGGLAAVKAIVRDCPDTRVLVLSMHDDPAYLRSVLAAGASGYVLKRSVDVELLTALRSVHRGGLFVDPSLAHVFVRDVLNKKHHGGDTNALAVLSTRECQVLRLVAAGHGSTDIARHLRISVKTVETYRARIAEKLDLHTRHEIVRFAVCMGLLTADTLSEPVPPQE
jgi:two-component system response regulator NreC